jgi:hypothetical protein
MPFAGASPAAAATTSLPVGNLPGWKQIMAEDFTTSVALGSFPTSSYARRFFAYTGGTDTFGHGRYDAKRVNSVSGGALDWYLHKENGQPYVSALVPVVPTTGDLNGRTVFGGSPTTGRASDSRLATVEAQSARAGLQAIGRAAEYRSSRPAENGRVDLFRADGCGTRSIGYSNAQPQDGKITVAYRSAQSGRFSGRICYAVIQTIDSKGAFCRMNRHYSFSRSTYSR